MLKTDRTAIYFIMAFASFQCWFSSVLPFRGDEAYLFLKSAGLSWFERPHPGVSGLALHYIGKISDNPFVLRLPSVLAMSIAAAFVYKSAVLLSGRIGGWAALIVFMLTPAVAQAYVSATPAPYFTLFSALAFFFWVKGFQTDKINYFLGAGAATGLAVFCHQFGYFLICPPVLYMLIFKRETLFGRNFVTSLIFFAACPITLAIGGFLGYSIAPGQIPFTFTEPKSTLIAISFLSIPIIIYVLSAILMGGFRIRELAFLNISVGFAILFVLALNLVSDFDFRYMPALFIPIFILTGAYFTRKDNKVFLGGLIALSVVISAYGNVAQKEGLPLPTGLKSTMAYIAIDAPLGNILSNSGAVFAETPEKASLFAFNTRIKEENQSQGSFTQVMTMMAGSKVAEEKFRHPEACLPAECSQKNGAIVLENSRINPADYFKTTAFYGIFRLTTPKDGTISFNIYTVSE